ILLPKVFQKVDDRSVIGSKFTAVDAVCCDDPEPRRRKVDRLCNLELIHLRNDLFNLEVLKNKPTGRPSEAARFKRGREKAAISLPKEVRHSRTRYLVVFVQANGLGEPAGASVFKSENVFEVVAGFDPRKL